MPNLAPDESVSSGTVKPTGSCVQSLGILRWSAVSVSRMVLTMSMPDTMLPYWSEPPICIWTPFFWYSCQKSQPWIRG